MDSIPETYAVTLHFYGGENTFTVVPGGSEGVYTDSEDSANTLTIDGQRVGEFQAADALTVNLGGIADTAGVPLSYEGKFTDAKVDPKKNDFNFGYGKVIAFAGSDGIVYTLRFFLDEEEKEFVLISVTVENTFETGGETVTVLQLWKSGREFAGVAQKAIVGVSLASESDVAQNIFNAPVDNGEKVVLVQEFMDTITGTYTYHAFLFDITYGENGFVSALADGGELDYGEAYAGIRYKIRFVYTMEDGVFHVCYLLTFTEGDSLVEATFRENGDGSWRITWHGGEFTLEITPN